MERARDSKRIILLQKAMKWSKVDQGGIMYISIFIGYMYTGLFNNAYVMRWNAGGVKYKRALPVKPFSLSRTAFVRFPPIFPHRSIV